MSNVQYSEETPPETGEAWKRWRLDIGASQADVAGVAEVSPTTVQKLERGENMSPKARRKILMALMTLDAGLRPSKAVMSLDQMQRFLSEIEAIRLTVAQMDAHYRERIAELEAKVEEFEAR